MSNYVGIDPTTGKAVFLGKEDPNNRPIAPRPQNSRYCDKCKVFRDNKRADCEVCHKAFQDTMMECPICHQWFDYLVGENEGNGRTGCEGCWKPNTDNTQRKEEVYDTSKEILS